MKKIIDGKIYNTETATLVAEDGNGLSSSDYGYEQEELYITKRGVFFLYGTGGAMSSYSNSNGRDSWGISVIKPLNKDETYKWLEECNNDDAIEAIENYFIDRIQEA